MINNIFDLFDDTYDPELDEVLEMLDDDEALIDEYIERQRQEYRAEWNRYISQYE